MAESYNDNDIHRAVEIAKSAVSTAGTHALNHPEQVAELIQTIAKACAGLRKSGQGQ